jgi:hypothetical protein
MAKFTDAKERTWEIPHFDPINSADVHQATNVSLYTLTADKLKGLHELYCNFPVFANVLYVLVGDQAKERGVDERSFMQGLVGGEAVEAAQEAFWNELLFFSPKKTRDLLTRMKTQMLAIQDETTLTDEQIKAGLIAGLNKLSGSSSELPDSPPAA